MIHRRLWRQGAERGHLPTIKRALVVEGARERVKPPIFGVLSRGTAGAAASGAAGRAGSRESGERAEDGLVPPSCHVGQRSAGGDEIHHAAEALEGALGVVLFLKVDFAAAAGVAVAQRLMREVQHRGWDVEARLRRAVAVDDYLRPRRARTRAFGVVIGIVVPRRFRVGKRVVVLHSLFVCAARQDWVPLGHALDPRVGLFCKRGRAWSCGLRPARGGLAARIEIRVDVDNIDVGPLLQVVCQQLAQ
jgi:hypothetical protein